MASLSRASSALLVATVLVGLEARPFKEQQVSSSQDNQKSEAALRIFMLYDALK